MSTLAVIPARGGGKGVRKKNLRSLGGHPLLVWTIIAAKRAELVDDIVVSTDDAEIMSVAERFGVRVMERPEHLSGDEVHASKVVINVLTTLRSVAAVQPDVTLMLLPTCPFRTAAEIDDAIRLLYRMSAESVVGIHEAQKRIIHFRTMEAGWLKTITATNVNQNRQYVDPLYVVNGCMFVVFTDSLHEQQSFHTRSTAGFLMPSSHSVDIDTLPDLSYARALVRRGIVERPLSCDGVHRKNNR